ncbi:DNA-binding protein [Phytophthora megakarya]|uniref:DNA-binding protein n=1 Tax=Phytophthora megakarya TaxID=4795 RepID=A0A225VGM2_9STRA|nr:DNA-binding protein [Phytophthora megakarya]
MDQRRGVSVRRHLSEADEKEALRVLREQLRNQQRVTSDDVRMAVRAVAGRGGAVSLPPDFPPSRWVQDFKRAHGLAQFDSFAFGAAASGSSSSQAVFGLPERFELTPLRSAASTLSRSRGAGSRNNRNQTRDGAAQVTSSSLSSSDDEKGPSASRRCVSGTAVTYSGPRPPYHNETQRQVQLEHSFSQRHRQHLQQQQRRATLVEDRRRAAAWPSTRGEHEAMHSHSSSDSLDSENGVTTGPSNSSSSSSDVGPGVTVDIGPMPHLRHTVSVNSVTSADADEMQDCVSNASSAKDKRGYKLSHTVPTETWEKAIAAVEQQGMSLRAAAKMYGVHFAALHRRVKKRAQGGQSKGSSEYFHPSDEAGIMRVVVARAELGVLMTFDELMRLVEAAALRKLPDITVDSARKLLTRFQSRNEQSIRHIIEDWPLPRPAAATSADEGARSQHQPYLEHPGFDFGPKSPVALRSITPDHTRKTSIAATMAAAAKTNLFQLPSRLGPLPSRVGGEMNETRRSEKRFMNGSGPMMMDNGSLPGALNDRLRFVGPRARSEGDVMVV